MPRWFSRKPARPRRSSRAPWTFETLEPRLLLSSDPLTTLQTEILTATLSENPEPAPVTGADTPSVPSVNLSVSATDGAEAGTTAITVTLTADAPVIGDQTVTLLASGNGITAGDYALTDGDEASGIQIKILDAQTTGSVVFSVKDDLLNEGAELVTLAIADPSQCLVLGDITTQDITITDDDDAGTSNYVLPEAGVYLLGLNGDTLEISDSIGTIVATRALGIDPLVINGTAGDDTLIVDFSTGDITVPITFNGGEQATEIGDAVTVIGTPELTATALPSATTDGDGTITVGDFGVVNFTGLEPTDLVGFSIVNITFSGANDVISIDHDSIPSVGAALGVSGTSGGVAFETFRLKNNTTVNIDTTTVDGTADIVTIEKANNSHGNTNLIITTGTGGGTTERIDIEGQATFTGNVTLTSARINSNAALNAGASGTVTLTANVGGIADGNGASVNVSAGNLVASAETGIGTAADALETSVTNLEAAGGTGGVNIVDANALTIGGIGATTGVSATGGNITITTTGLLTVNETVTNTGGGNITLTAGPTGAGTVNDDLQLNANVQASGGSGNVVLNAAADILQGVTVAATGGGAIDYNAGTGATLGTISMSGPALASTTNGLVTMDADGNILLGAVNAATALITSTTGGIVDANGASTNVAAAATVLRTTQGIGAGDAIETSVANLEATGGTGGVNVANTGNLTIGGVGATTGVSATGGNITVTSSGALALGESVTNPAGAVTLAATGGALSSVSGATLSSTTGATLTSGANGTFAGIIAGAGTLLYQGSAVLTLTAANTYGGATTINGGTLLVNGSISSPSVTVQSTATLGGSGSVAGTVAVQNGGFLSPGSSPAILSTGSVSLVPGSTFKAEVNGTVAGTGYDQLAVTGTVNLGNATLNISGTIASPSASPIVLISNDGTDAVSGTFAGLAEGAVVMINGIPFTISYVGGSNNNDVVLQSQATVNLAVSAGTGTEAGSTVITVTATANAPVGGDQTVDLGVSGTHIAAGDYTLSNNIISILSGQTSGSVTFTVNNDTLLEGAETVLLTMSNPSAGLILGLTTTQNIGITDNESATLAIAATSSVAEQGGAQSVGVVTLTIGGTGTGTFALGDGISLTADVVDAGTGTASSATDYAAFDTQTVTFNGGAASGATRNTTLSPVNDLLLEGSETVALTLQNLGGSTVTSSLGNVNNVTTITDDESATLAIAATSAATEQGGPQTVGVVTLTIAGSGIGPSALGTGINLTADVIDAGTGTAIGGTDYTAFGTQTVTFSGGALSGATRNTTLSPVNDRLLEGNETVALTLQNLNGSAVTKSLGNTANTTTITDNESATLAIAATSAVTEQGGAQNVGVTLAITGSGSGTFALGDGITLTADVVDLLTGTAISSTDYAVFGTQTVTFTGGAATGTTQNVSLSPLNDKLLEGSETVNLTLQNLGGSAVDKSLGNTANVTTITDNESATLDIAETSSVTETGGTQNVGVVTLTITGTGTGAGPFELGSGISLTANVVDAGTGTASSGADYAAFGVQPVTFNSNAQSGATQSVSLSPVNDKLLEGGETVHLTLQSLGGSAVAVVLGATSNETTITDDESATLDIATTSSVTEAGGAQSVGVVTLTITGTGTTAGPFALGSGITLTADVVNPAGGTATSGADYAVFGTQPVTFSGGAVSGATDDATLSVVNDQLLEGSETVNLRLQNLGGSAVNALLGATGNVTTITDDESATLAIAATSTATEQGGAQNVGVTLTIAGNGTGPLALGAGITLTADVIDAGGGTAGSGTDYSAFGTQTVTFDNGAASGTTKNVSLSPVNDTLLEGSETVNLALGNLSGSNVAKTLGNTANVTTITDDESATLAIEATSAATEQGGPQSVGVVTLTIAGSGTGTFALGTGISLTADVVDAGTGTAISGTDYTAFGAQTVTFNGGALSGATRNTTLSPANDLLLEGSETVALTLQNLGGSAVTKTLGNTANVTTISDDESATLAIAATSSATETGEAAQAVGVVTLTISGTGTGPSALGTGISLTADVVDAGTGTAISGTDYAAFGTQTVTFNGGAASGTTQSVSLTPVNDRLLEGSETVALTLGNLNGSAVTKSLGNTANTTTITDDESATLAIAATSSVTEAGGPQSVGTVTLTITGSGTGTFALGPGISLSADVVDAGGGTAISGTDYTVFGAQSVTFNNGAVSGATKSVSLTPVSDNVVEPNETVRLKLQNLGGSAVTRSFGNTYNVTTITDDDTATDVGAASVQYSDKVKLSATITTGAAASLTGTVKFSIYAGGVWTQVASAAVNSVNTASVTVDAITTQILLAPGSYSYKAEFCSTSPAYNGSVDTDTLTVAREDAQATYVGPAYVSTPNATATTAIVPLQATIVDINDLSAPGGLGLRGNVDNDDVTNLLTNARVTFTVYDAATNTFVATFSNVAVNLLNPADPTVGTALFSWTANIGSADAVTYRVHTVVTNYYTRDTVLDDELVTVAKPLDNSITGGGYIVNTDSAGLYAADDGLKTNFGFNVKLNKSGTNAQGKVNIIFRRLEDDGVEHIYQIKSTAISSVGVNAADGTSTFLSKANLTDITNPFAPISLGGNLDLTVRTDDNGEPGSGSNNKGTDKISVALFNGPVLWFSSNFSGGVQSQLQVVDGGNIRNHPNDERLLYFVNSASNPTAPGDQTSTEGDTGYQNMVFTVRLSQASTQTVKVNYSTADGDAIAGSDYVATSGTLTFAPGVTTATFTVQIKGDLLAESDELFYVTLSGASGAGIQDPISMGIIADNEHALHVTGGPNVGGQVGDDLQSAMLTPVVTAAVEFWAAQGVSAGDLATLAGTTIRIEDLGGSLLGATGGGIITLDDDAAGYGWSTSLTAVDSGEVDLLSAVVHEFGHVLGLEHNVLDPDLAVGARELPVLVATAQPAPTTAGVTVLASPDAPGRQTGLASFAKSIEWHIERAAGPGLPQESARVLLSSLIDWHVERAGAQSQSESVDVPSLIDWASDGAGPAALAAKALRPWLLQRS